MAEKTTSAAEEKTTAAEQGSSTAETSITTTTAIETTTERTTEESSSYIYKESSTEEETTAETEESTEEPTEISTESNEKETTQESTEEETTPPTTTERPTEAPTQKPTEPPTQAPTTAQPTQAPTQAPTKPEPTTPEPTTEAPTKPQVVLTGIEASVANKTRYIGDTLTAGDFTVKGIYSDGSKKDINGWNAAPLKLNAASNSVTVTYQGMSTVVTVAATVKPTEPLKEAKLVDLEIVTNGKPMVPGWTIESPQYERGFDVYAVYSDGKKVKVEAELKGWNGTSAYVISEGYTFADGTGGNRFVSGVPVPVTLEYKGIKKSTTLTATGANPTKADFCADAYVQYSGTYTAADINNGTSGLEIKLRWDEIDYNGVRASSGSTTTGFTYKGGPFYVDCGATTTINIVFENQTIPVSLEATTGFSRAAALKNFAILNNYRKNKGLPELTWWENGYEYSQLRLIEATEDISQYGWSAEAGHKRDYLWGLETFSTLDGGVNYKDDIDQLMHSTEHNLIIMGGDGIGGLCSIAVWDNDCMIITIVYSSQVNTSIYIDKDYNMHNPDGSIFRQHRPGWDGTPDPRWVDICNQGGH